MRAAPVHSTLQAQLTHELISSTSKTNSCVLICLTESRYARTLRPARPVKWKVFLKLCLNTSNRVPQLENLVSGAWFEFSWINIPRDDIIKGIICVLKVIDATELSLSLIHI